VALRPDATVSVVTPTLSIVPASTILPVKMPIDPVSVPGCATSTCPGMAM
jgi:hypothetical protein